MHPSIHPSPPSVSRRKKAWDIVCLHQLWWGKQTCSPQCGTSWLLELEGMGVWGQLAIV